MRNNQVNNNLNQQLNNEIIKNQRLESEIRKLINDLNTSKQVQENQKNEINSLRAKIKQLQYENQNLRNVNKFNIGNNQISINEVNLLKQKINELELKLKKVGKQSIYMDDVMVVNFKSLDHTIRTGIPCMADDTFAEVEEKLYQMYNEYRNTNNILLFQGNTILRFKKIRENKIKNGDTIIIIIPQ